MQILKLQYFGYLMWRTDSLEKTLMLGKIEGRRGSGQQRLDGIIDKWTWVWVSSGRWWRTGKPGVLQSMGSQRVGHDWDWRTTGFLGFQLDGRLWDFSISIILCLHPLWYLCPIGSGLWRILIVSRTTPGEPSLGQLATCDSTGASWLQRQVLWSLSLGDLFNTEIAEQLWKQWKENSFTFLKKYLFIYLAALGLSRGTWDLHYIMWDLLLWCLGSAVVDHGLRCPMACRILGFPGGACNKEPPCNAGSKEHFLHCKTDS